IKVPADLPAAVQAAKNPATIEVARQGDEKPIQLTATLAGEPILVGIAWQFDDAEPNTVTIVRIVPGSPPERAGLQLGDRGYRVGGKDFSSSEQFERLLMSQPNPLELTVENRGQIRHVRVKKNDGKD